MTTPPEDNGNEIPQNVIEQKLIAVENKLEGFLLGVRIMTIALSILVAGGLFATYTGAVERFQNLIETKVVESVANTSSDLKDEIINYANTAEASASDAEKYSESAQDTSELASQSLDTFNSGVGTLEALVGPIYATATAQAIIIEEGDFYSVVVTTYSHIDSVERNITVLKDQIDAEFTIYLLPEGLYVGTVGRFASKDLADDYKDFVSKYVYGPYILDMGAACPIRQQKEGYIQCRSRVNE
jgi:hypothetical protein